MENEVCFNLGLCGNKISHLYVKRLSIPPKIEAYIQTIVLKKTLENISLDFVENSIKRARTN
ncbi:hypothetical protein NUSPORA_01164 [Nucleospora cyclopteri]